MDSMSQNTLRTYPRYVSWHISLADVANADALFSPSTRKKIRRGLRALEDAGYHFSVTELCTANLETFYTQYCANITVKTNPRVIDLPAWFEEKQAEGKVFYLLALEKQGVFHGGIVFRLTDTKLSTAYKVFPKQLDDVVLPIGPTMLAEHALFSHALSLGKQKIVHGRDRNLYGDFSAIGLAMFKTQLGATPMVSLGSELFAIDTFTWDGTHDVLMFQGDTHGAPITTAVLYTPRTEEEAKEKYAQLWKTDAYQVMIQHEHHIAS